MWGIKVDGVTTEDRTTNVTLVQPHVVAASCVKPRSRVAFSPVELQLRQTVKPKRDFTFLLQLDQHPDLIVARPAARAIDSVTATLYAPIHSSYSFINSKMGDRQTVSKLNSVRFG